MTRFFTCIAIILLFTSCKKEDAGAAKNGETLDSATIITPAIVKDNERKIAIDTAQLSVFKSQLLVNFYKSSGYETVWGNLKKRQFVLFQLEKAEDYGLNPADYHVKKLQDFEKKISELNDKQLIAYDLNLTMNFQKFLLHLYKGKLDPKKLYTDWELKAKSFNVNEVLITAFNDDNLETALLKSQPKTYTYQKLINALKLINTFPEDSVHRIQSADKIVLNDTNSEVIKIKKRLRFWKDLPKSESLSAVYNQKTFDAVKKFQSRHGLISDGVVGKGTVAALNYSKEKRKHQIIANLERWRWYTDEFTGNYLIINIPDYSLQVVEEKDTVLSRNVIVGTNKRRTPILTSTLKTIVFNPTWTVPPTILKEDVVPSMQKNRNYLAKKNITIYDKTGTVVDPQDWNENNPHAYRYVQKPGRSNSLGLMKILFPNNHSVYLHDTNHRGSFDRQNRSMSSGCVRIENPLDLAEHLLNDAKNWSTEKIDSLIVTEKTTGVRITKKYELYQWYWTAWSEPNQLQFRPDIYNLDADLYAKLRN